MPEIRRDPTNEQSQPPPRKERAPRTGGRRTQLDQIRESLTQIYTMIGMGVSGIGHARKDPGLNATGQAVVARAESITEEWIELAEQNAAVRSALIRLTQGAGIGGLVMLHFACLTPFLASRGVIPEEAMMGALLMTQPGFDPADAVSMFTQQRNGNGDPDQS